MIETSNIIVVDVEATCWEGDPPPGQVSEIIEIGACRLDAVALDILDRTQIYVRPTCSEVSPFCTSLTGITAATLGAQGIRFDEACALIRSTLRTKSYPWAAWGDYDRKQFERQCNDPDRWATAVYPFGPTFLNIKALFGSLTARRLGPGLGTAIASLGWTFCGQPHCGADDALNVARVLADIIRRYRQETP